MRTVHGISERYRDFQNPIFIFRGCVFGIYRTAESRRGNIVIVFPGSIETEAVIKHLQMDIFFFNPRYAIQY